MNEQNVSIEPKKNLAAFQALLEIDEKERSFKVRQGYTRSYVLSLLFPPVGIYYFLKYLLFANGTEDDRRAGIISLILTTIALIFSIWLSLSLFKQTSSIVPSTQSNEILKELITPENQQKFKELFQ